MPLSAGDKFGPFEMIASQGAGGMGEVDKASDTLIKRDLARKALIKGPALAEQRPGIPGTAAHFIRRFLPD
jgi:hypothetical protein